MKKIIVIGSGGAGKSIFSSKLGEALRINVVHLDRLYWKPNWVKTPKEEWVSIVERELARDSWVMDGNFGGTREMRMRACDTVIFLDMPRRICLYRILKRRLLYRGTHQPEMTEGCNEKFDSEFIGWIWNYPKRTKPRVLAELEQFPDKKVVILRSKREVSDFFARLR